VRKLVTWCREHHSNTLVKSRYDNRQCDDEPGHLKMRAFLRWMKNKALQEDSTSFNEAFAAMDEAFGPEVWRLKPGTRL
jgi:predicted aminopeptidase